MSISVNQNVLLIVLIISTVFLIVAIYYIKRKFDAIDEYNKNVADKLKSYKEIQSNYKQNLDDIELLNKELKLISIIGKLLTDIIRK